MTGPAHASPSTSSPLRVAFAGTPEFAAVALAAILQAGHDVVLVATQPDRPAGRGMKLQASAVKRLAAEHHVSVIQPAGLRLGGKYASDADAARASIEAAQADVIVVAAYGLILPQWVLDSARLGCLNIHGSLLPRWRGAAPIHRAVEAGDSKTGITVMQMDAGLDTGAMLLEEAVDIEAGDTTGSLHDRLAALGGRLIVEALRLAAGPGLRPVAQPKDGVTYAHKISKDEALIDWTQSGVMIERRLRAFDPFPGATTMLGGEVVKCWRGELVSDTDPAAASLMADGSTPRPGTLLDVSRNGVIVACGNGLLRLTELQRPGGKRLPVGQLLQSASAGESFVAGRAFDAPKAAADKG